jgi:hypothetical protein
MTKEYTDSEILEFVSAGPKQYGLKLRNNDGEKEVIKLRGITINYQNNKLKHDTLKNLVLIYNPEAHVTFNYPDKFGPTSDGHIYTTPMSKNYKPVNNKGIIDEDLNVLPFGYDPGRDSLYKIAKYYKFSE